MESRIVNTFLLLFFLFCGLSANQNNTEIGIEPRKLLNIEIETSRGVRISAVDNLRNKILSDLKEIQIFRYCFQNEPIEDQDEDQFLRINLIRISSTKYAKRLTETFIKEIASKNKTTVVGKENVFTEKCRIHLDPNCDFAEYNENLNYSEWLLHPEKIDNYTWDINFTRDNEIICIEKSGYEEVNFNVNKTMLGIYIIVDGDFSNISIEIPIETKQESTTSPMTLSMSRREDTQGVEIVALNAPPGGWRLKLEGEGASKYSFIVGKIRRKEESLLDVATMPRETLATERKSFDNIEIFDDVQDNRRIYDDSWEDLEVRNGSFSSLQVEKTGETRSRLINDPRNKIIFENNDVQTNTSVSRMMESNQELTEEFARIGDDEKEEKRRIVVELNENSDLFVRQGTIHRIVFDVTNNHFQTVGCYFKVRSLPLAVYNVQPLYTWIFAGRTVNVYVDVEVPRRTSQDVINTLTLSVQSSEIIEKSVYLYIEGTTGNVVDDTKPSIEYTFNNNCAGRLNKDRCAKSRWSVDIRIQDSGSGLKNVKASPNELYPRTEYVSGTKNPVTFYYSSTCCTTQARITATDLRNNVNSYTVDVTVWDNLSEAEIAAITVGALLILLVIILIVILIVYCVRKRKSHDLPYTQRYGSRPPARAERTSF